MWLTPIKEGCNKKVFGSIEPFWFWIFIISLFTGFSSSSLYQFLQIVDLAWIWGLDDYEVVVMWFFSNLVVFLPFLRDVFGGIKAFMIWWTSSWLFLISSMEEIVLGVRSLTPSPVWTMSVLEVVMTWFFFSPMLVPNLGRFVTN